MGNDVLHTLNCRSFSNVDHVLHVFSKWRQLIFCLGLINDVMMSCVDPSGQRPADTVGWNKLCLLRWSELSGASTSVVALLRTLSPILYFQPDVAYNQWFIERGVISSCHHFTHTSGTVIYNPPQPRGEKKKGKKAEIATIWFSLMKSIDF